MATQTGKSTRAVESWKPKIIYDSSKDKRIVGNTVQGLGEEVARSLIRDAGKASNRQVCGSHSDRLLSGSVAVYNAACLTMAGTQMEIALCSWPWRASFSIYGGLACNSLMADVWADRTALHDAAYQGRFLTLRTLIMEGFPVDILTMDRVSPLHEACLGGHYSCAEFLLENGANVELVSADGATPLFNACRFGSVACVRLILRHCTSTNLARHLASPIHEAAKRGHRECLELLLSHGAYVDLELPGLGTPLYAACQAQATSCVDRLLQSGADVQAGCGRDTPLHVAVRGGGVRLVELLMDYGADGCCRNSDGKTPLELASADSMVRIMMQKRGPCTLRQLCRLCIRRSLGRVRLDRMSGLQLPHRLKAFLLYQ